jgi:hypothetical protein
MIPITALYVVLIVTFKLLLLFQLKHFIADYPLQRPWMLGKFLDKGWVLPLAAHCGVHALFTIAIGLFCGWVPISVILVMAAFDFVIHFTMDRIKASKRWLGRFKPLNGMEYVAMTAAAQGNPIGAPYPIDEAKARLRSNRWFWHSIGIDQMVHHLTHYAIILVYLLFLLP